MLAHAFKRELRPSRRSGTRSAMMMFEFHKPINCPVRRLLPAAILSGGINLSNLGTQAIDAFLRVLARDGATESLHDCFVTCQCLFDMTASFQFHGLLKQRKCLLLARNLPSGS